MTYIETLSRNKLLINDIKSCKINKLNIQRAHAIIVILKRIL